MIVNQIQMKKVTALKSQCDLKLSVKRNHSNLYRAENYIHTQESLKNPGIALNVCKTFKRAIQAIVPILCR